MYEGISAHIMAHVMGHNNKRRRGVWIGQGGLDYLSGELLLRQPEARTADAGTPLHYRYPS
jgi:hypothetical protein